MSNSTFDSSADTYYFPNLRLLPALILVLSPNFLALLPLIALAWPEVWCAPENLLPTQDLYIQYHYYTMSMYLIKRGRVRQPPHEPNLFI